MTYNTAIVLAGTGLLGAGAGLAGSFAVLRSRALLGDALAHAGLPGICLAFLLWGERSLPVLLLGALASGMLGVACIAGLRRFTRIKQDAAIGIVLSTFFGAGISLSRIIQGRATSGSKAGLDSYNLGKTAGMISEDVVLIGLVSLACLLLVLVLYKEFKLVAFDPSFARVQGWPAFWLDVLLTLLVAVMVVIGLPAVGVVLMAAMLIMPGAAARFWTDRLESMLALAAVLGAAVGALGTLASAQFSLTPAGPVIVLVGAAVFGVSLLVAPRHGLLARWFATRSFARRFDEQRILAWLYDRLGSSGQATSYRASDLPASFRHREPLNRRRIQRLISSGQLDVLADGSFRLSPAGWQRAASVVRGWRLWQAFILAYPDLAQGYAELDAEDVDERLSPSTIVELEAQLRSAGRWPELALSANR